MKLLVKVCLVLQMLLSAGASYAQQSSVVDLDRIVVTASRIGQHDYKIAGNVTVIDKKQIENSNAQNIPDILDQTLGVNIYDSSTSKSSVLDIRGFGDTAARNVLVLVNDRRVNAADISGADLVQIPIEAIEKIEIIRGAGSILYGDNAVGGVVNIITKKGKGTVSGEVGFSMGSYDKRKTDITISGEKHNVSYYLYSKYNDERGYRQNSDLLAKDFNARVGYSPTDKISMDLNIGWHEDNQGLPGGLSISDLESLGRKGSKYETDFSNTKDRNMSLGFEVNPWPDDFYFGKFVVDFYYRNRDTYAEFNKWGDYHTKRSSDTKGITGKYIFDRTIFDREVNFVTGVEYYDDESEILGSGLNADDVTISKEEIGIYGFMESEVLEKLFLSGGVRYHQANYKFSDRNVYLDEEKKPEEWISGGGFKYEYGKGSNVHLNVQKTFRFLATDEWYQSAYNPTYGVSPQLNTDLEQQVGLQYEVGIKHNFNDALMVNVTPYWMDNKNEIFFDPTTFANSNYDKTRRIGVEVGKRINIAKLMDIGLFDDLEFFTNYTYQDAKFNGGSNNKKLIPMVPTHQADCGVSMKFLDNFIVSFAGKYVGSRFAINDVGNATPKAKPYYVADGKFSYKRRNLE
ncbi:MAG: TonB-dependent receptor, partial [Candidatus Heimdallarchaeota archaeon]|nr:TonB-dependent receptor [Candidatus Heimdallarchaeota archaeon]